MKVDILAIGAHPDDVELSCGGTLLKQKALGNSFAIIDLTGGELGTRGSKPLRLEEAEAAANILGADARENLNFEDGFFKNDKAHQLELVKLIRKYRPDVVLTNAIKDRHPDHPRASQLTKEACFLSGLTKLETELDGKAQDCWRPNAVYHYIQAIIIEPDFVVDISDYFETKMKAIEAYKSQFYSGVSNADEPETYISTPDFLEMIKARAINYGKAIGVKYAEGYTTERYVGVDDLFKLI